jgi:hypothetical protein
VLPNVRTAYQSAKITQDLFLQPIRPCQPQSLDLPMQKLSGQPTHDHQEILMFTQLWEPWVSQTVFTGDFFSRKVLLWIVSLIFLRSRILDFGAIDILGCIVPCCRGLSWALQGVDQPSWPLLQMPFLYPHQLWASKYHQELPHVPWRINSPPQTIAREEPQP